ncbi:hypothetical protein [Variovorax sp. E3]|uniref:hypothetical protein n=1 Tax=Variovorax sp. E3 TaxID=1914993 RepID=UPI0018DC4135|nr:hypothetical protein [Variovorax sp. E3]
MNDIGTIEMTVEEKTLVDVIDFGADFRDRDAVLPMLAAAGKVTPMLLARGAIPERRQQCFTQPGWGAGRKSRLEVFEGNGTRGAEIFSHGNFLKFLRFFIHGAELPLAVKVAMRDQVDNPQWFTSGDREPLRKLGRQLARAHCLDGSSADEFMYLCADLGLDVDDADSVRRAIKDVRAR